MNQEVTESDLRKSEKPQSLMIDEIEPCDGFKRLDDDVECRDFIWDSNTNAENLQNLPWPDENESKE